MPISLTLNPSGPADFIGSTTSNSLAIDAVFRGLPAQNLWIIFDPANHIATPDRVFIPHTDIVSGETTLQIQLEPNEGLNTVTAQVATSDNVVLDTVSDDIELDLPNFNLLINDGDAYTDSTFVDLTIQNIPPGEILWVIMDGYQIKDPPLRICFGPSEIISGEVTFSKQLLGAINGSRKVDILLYQDDPYIFWGSASDTIDLQLPPPNQPILNIHPDGYSACEGYTRFNEGYVRLSNLIPGDPLWVTLSGDLFDPLDTIDLFPSDTTLGFFDIDVSMDHGASAGDGYEDGIRIITALVKDLEQRESYASNQIILDTTPPKIAIIPNFSDSVLSGIPTSIEILSNEPAEIVFSVEGYSEGYSDTTDSYTDSLEVTVDEEQTSLLVRAYGIDCAGNISQEKVVEFILNITPHRASRVGESNSFGGIISDADNQGEAPLPSGHRVGRPEDDFIHDLPRVRKPDHDQTPSFIDDPLLEILNINTALFINEKAMVFEIDDTQPMPVQIIMRPHGSLRDANRGGFIDANIKELDPYISGGFVTAFDSPGSGIRDSRYWDSNSLQWIRNRTSFDPIQQNFGIFDSYIGRSRFVFEWFPYKGTKLF